MTARPAARPTARPGNRPLTRPGAALLTAALLAVAALTLGVLGGDPVFLGTAADDGPSTEHPVALQHGGPAVTNLDPALLEALHGAAAGAAEAGIELRVNSGWRSEEHQQQLLDEAVATYGSEHEAARWVAPPDRSAHVSGDAVDIGPAGAATWLDEHGSAWGLCRTYRNEPWHFELRPRAVDRGCPEPYADPTEDPRLQP